MKKPLTISVKGKPKPIDGVGFISLFEKLFDDSKNVTAVPLVLFTLSSAFVEENYEKATVFLQNFSDNVQPANEDREIGSDIDQGLFYSIVCALAASAPPVDTTKEKVLQHPSITNWTDNFERISSSICSGWPVTPLPGR